MCRVGGACGRTRARAWKRMRAWCAGRVQTQATLRQVVEPDSRAAAAAGAVVANHGARKEREEATEAEYFKRRGRDTILRCHYCDRRHPTRICLIKLFIYNRRITCIVNGTAYHAWPISFSRARRSDHSVLRSSCRENNSVAMLHTSILLFFFAVVLVCNEYSFSAFKNDPYLHDIVRIHREVYSSRMHEHKQG